MINRLHVFIDFRCCILSSVVPRTLARSARRLGLEGRCPEDDARLGARRWGLVLFVANERAVLLLRGANEMSSSGIVAYSTLFYVKAEIWSV